MKKRITILLFAVILSVVVYAIPFQWFMVSMGMPKKEVYERCGPPASTDLWDIKGERWDNAGMLGNWTMYVGFKKGKAMYSSGWLDLGRGDYSIRIYLISDGKVLFRI